MTEHPRKERKPGDWHDWHRYNIYLCIFFLAQVIFVIVVLYVVTAMDIGWRVLWLLIPHAAVTGFFLWMAVGGSYARRRRIAKKEQASVRE